MSSKFLGGPGYDSYQVPTELFQYNRQKVITRLQEYFENKIKAENESNTKECHQRYIIVLKGGISPTRYDTDHEPIFRQESYFWWLTGVKEPDCSIVIIVDITVDINTVTSESRTILFVPCLPPEYATIMGKIRTLEEWNVMYGIDEVLYNKELESYVALNNYIADFVFLYDFDFDNNKIPSTQILLMSGVNTDSGIMYDTEKTIGNEPQYKELLSVNDIDIDTTILFPVLAGCRVYKSKMEVQLMEHVTQITSFAHVYVMRNLVSSLYEYQCESLFKHYIYYNYGSRLLAYTAICGCGPNSAILHYGHTGEPNSKFIQEKDHCLFDMGAEYQCYASDVTCSYPANGKFDTKYKAIYECVLNAQRAVYKLMTVPGTSYVECHIIAELEIVKGLYKIGIIQIPDNDNDNDNESDYVDKKLEELVRSDHRLGAVFMPCGLGHFIGIDTHDVGGYLDDNDGNNKNNTPTTIEMRRIDKPGLKALRTTRILKPNMVLTVEPGCYFIDHLLDEALKPQNHLSTYLNKQLIDNEYRGYGGVRLEDVVKVSSDDDDDNGGDNDDVLLPSSYYVHNLTLCPRTVKEVEYVMAGGKWPPIIDDAPELCRLKLTNTNITPLPSPPSK
ncbi:Peptidase_M24-domain-containing protein [Fragilariopsis cylindrus CCMP1102]|uniref:Xaa-Pro dipeptidase n=1 Tax=Fragilariopsis cylindrus CCMP1102 TaxID=635003 RepID=A0A1E7FU13_9STRA|nr:Peptidase_M24-domain-containing protein [Fragilariopsis cylindrus CCMP1102]|eukprot:OEU21638.1 Peptidase_M24-domain-containing protein [Fragilariopsis cylindrus CCMP1102]